MEVALAKSWDVATTCGIRKNMILKTGRCCGAAVPAAHFSGAIQICIKELGEG